MVRGEKRNGASKGGFVLVQEVATMTEGKVAEYHRRRTLQGE